MGFAAGIYSHLMSDGTIGVLAEGRVYRTVHGSESPEVQRLLSVVFWQTGESDLAQHIDQLGRMWTTQWRVACAGESDTAVDDLADAVRSRLHGFRGAIGELSEYTVQYGKLTSRADSFEEPVFVTFLDFEVQFRAIP